MMAFPQAHAAGVSGQGTWETTLQARDLDGDASTIEAYYDSDLDITWLADASYVKTSGYDADGRLSSGAAETWASNLNVNGITGWRLPDVKPVNGSSFNATYSVAGTTDQGYNITSTQSELAHLYYVTLGNKAYCSTDGSCSQSGWGLSNTGPFKNVETTTYWSGVEYRPSNVTLVWNFRFGDGFQTYGNTYNDRAAWAVRSGDVAAAVPEPETYTLALAGLAAAALLARKRRT